PAPGGTFAWNADAAAPQALAEAMGVSVGGKLYTFGGFNVTAPSYLATTAAQMFDPVTHRWTAIAPLPSPLTHSGTATDGRYIYVAGGYVSNLATHQQIFATTNVWRYDTQANAWSAFTPLPAARGAGALVLVGRQLHFMGGVDISRNEKTDHWVLNLDNPAAGWNTAANTPGPRNHLGAVTINGKIYIVGGQVGQDQQAIATSSVYIYDPAQDPLLNSAIPAGTNPWSPGPSLPAARGHLTQSTFAWDGQIVVVGGEDANHNPTSTVWILDPAADGWAALPSLPGARGEPVAQAVGDTFVVTTGSFNTSTWTGVLHNHWETQAPMPYVTGEVAGGIINDVAYLNSGSHSYAYHIATNTWSYFAQPPVLLNHEAAEVYNGKLYYFGGLYEEPSTPNNPWRGTSVVQIFDPSTNTWTRGADIPFTTGSAATALIGGKIYLAGGIGADGYTHNNAAVYDPNTNAWTMIASEPFGRNHTAAGTDGSLFYIFGGRGPGNGSQNTTTNGFDTVQIYNPATNTWITSLDPTGSGARLAPLPQARGGMGKAVFYNGEFYIMGGETLNGPNATPQHTYTRVDIYNPLANTWRLGSPMITGRHGIFPLLDGDRIYVAGGGAIGGDGDTGINEVYTLGG
ncbi:MAG TPA: kelch repeat-containing protein, partial [Tepidisphaeraceae bacterium]|nr:kelch repeat-containing protein [Tepidisphaeraceae bacterium]